MRALSRKQMAIEMREKERQKVIVKRQEDEVEEQVRSLSSPGPLAVDGLSRACENTAPSSIHAIIPTSCVQPRC